MNWFLGVFALAIILFLIYNYRKKKRETKRRKILNNLVQNWGNHKKHDHFYFPSIEKYFINNNQKEKSYHIISDRCATDIDVNETFKIIDRTSSRIGQQYLYYKLRTIESKNNLFIFSKLTVFFEENEELRLKVQLELLKINSDDSYNFENLVTSKPIEKPKLINLVYAFTIASITCVFLGIFFPVFLIFLIPILGVNIAFHYKNKWNISNYIEGVSQLSKALIVAQNITRFPEIKKYFVDLTFIREIEKIKLKTEFISFERNSNDEFTLVLSLLTGFIKVFFNLEYIVFYSFIESITNKKQELEKMFRFIGEIDAAISTASVKVSKYKICNPIFIDEKKIIVTQISHPLIENCVLNDLNLSNSSLLLTGSNMSGKTTFIRSVSINSVLAQTLNICFAQEYCAPFFKLFSSIRINDNLLENTSYYLEEVLTIKELIEESQDGNPCLFVLDEIFKGTNTIERISAGKAILSFLNKGSNIVLVSTHDIELTDILSKENFDLYHFSEQIDDNQLTFDHKLKEGKLKTRNAIKILELYNYPSEIINDAKSTEKSTFGNSQKSIKNN